MKLFLCICLIVVDLISAIGVVKAKHETRRLFTEIQGLDKYADQLNEEWGRLKLEQSTWAANANIETFAIHELEMKLPDINSIILIK